MASAGEFTPAYPKRLSYLTGLQKLLWFLKIIKNIVHTAQFYVTGLFCTTGFLPRPPFCDNSGIFGAEGDLQVVFSPLEWHSWKSLFMWVEIVHDTLS